MLQGKVAVVTGGTRGIGLSIVETYLENGAKVVVCGSRQETVDIALAHLKDKGFVMDNVMGICPDLSDAKEIKEAFKKVVDTFGSLDILVNNAGISQHLGILDYPDGDFEKIMKLNVNALFVCTKEAVGYMKEKGAGVIINTSSMVSMNGQSSGVGYPTSKFAVNGMTKSLARELGPIGIRVNAVAPGVTNTDMVKALSSEMIQPIINTIPLRRVGEPEEVAQAFLFLASDMASYISGAILEVDGATVC